MRSDEYKGMFSGKKTYAIRKPKKQSKVIYVVLLVLLCVAIAVRIGMLIAEYIDYRKGVAVYDLLKPEISAEDRLEAESLLAWNGDSLVPENSHAVLIPADELLDFSAETDPGSDDGDENRPLTQYERYQIKVANAVEMKQKNSDFLCWITVPGTTIDYPVVKGSDNSFYLDHGFSGQKLAVGTPFADYRCGTDLTENYNTVIYGHRTRYDIMFSGVAKFADHSFFDEHQYIYLYTTDAVMLYEIYSFMTSSMYSGFNRVVFADGTDFSEYAAAYRREATYDRANIEIGENDRILTLSTCTNIIQEDRYVLQARLSLIIPME